MEFLFVGSCASFMEKTKVTKINADKFKIKKAENSITVKVCKLIGISQ